MGEIVCGRNPLLETLKVTGDALERLYIKKGASGRIIEELLSCARKRGVVVEFVDRRFLDALPAARNHQGVAGVMKEFTYSTIQEILGGVERGYPLLIALDRVQDTGNFGAIIRSAVFFGAWGMIVPEHGSCRVTSGVHRSSSGAVIHIKIARVTNLGRALEELKGMGIWIYGFEGDAEAPLHSADMQRPLCLVLGSEGKGMRRGIREKCDALYSIPGMGGVDSLNVSIAASIVLYEARRGR